MMLKTFALILCLFVLNSAVDCRVLQSKVCTAEKLIPSLEFDAVSEALNVVKNNPPGVTRSATVGPYTVWARSECFASDCNDCVNELADKIWGFCDNAKGAHIFYTTCTLRYEFYPF